MKAAKLTRELAAIQVNTRRILGLSIVLHLLLVAWLSVLPDIAPGEEVITEITWLEPEPIPQILSSPPKPTPRRLVRATEPPPPKDVIALDTKINERLASLQSGTSRRSKPIDGLETPVPGRRPTLAAANPTVTTPRTLTRRATTAPRPVKLERNAPKIQRSTMAVPDMLDTPTPTRVKAETVESTAKRTVAGMTVTGPVADRALISYEKPTYPEWAKQEAVEGSVSIYFVVMPDGKVKENVMVQKTSGFGDFDQNATDALLAWRFAPLKSGQTGEQWGTITIHYRLN